MAPEAAEKMVKLGFNVAIEKGAGELANISDAAFEKVGCKIMSTEEIF